MKHVLVRPRMYPVADEDMCEAPGPGYRVILYGITGKRLPVPPHLFCDVADFVEDGEALWHGERSVEYVKAQAYRALRTYDMGIRDVIARIHVAPIRHTTLSLEEQ